MSRSATPAYVELQVTSNFSFLRGASHPDELALTAAALGMPALAVTDRNSLAGVVRAHVAARNAGIRLVVGARLDLGLGLLGDGAAIHPHPTLPHQGGGRLRTGGRHCAPSPLVGEGWGAETSLNLLCYPTDRAAYGRLSRLLTLGRRRAPKGECWLSLDDVLAHDEGQIFIVLPPVQFDSGRPDAGFAATLHRLGRRWRGRCYLAAQHRYRGNDARRLAGLSALAEAARTPLIACNDVHYHTAARRPLQDVLTCIREHCTIDEAGFRLAANAERHLKPPAEMARLFAAYPQAVTRTGEIAERCRFSLDELCYEYPAEPVPEGRTPQEELERLTWEGAAGRYGGRVPEKVKGLLAHELGLIGSLGYAPYFLTVHDIVRFARGRGILCQGRGSAANSAVCYCLGITAVDPDRLDLLFERFVSAERREPPDIDVDFEHERREEVIQYIYEKYGRERAGLAATVISYRAKSAIREVGKALGLSADVVGALANNFWGWGPDDVAAERVREIGLDPRDRRLAQAIHLARQLIGFPRHLSQHVGGFVITRGPLSEVVPIENAAMAERTVIEWDKDDLAALRMLKIDVLALGMLTCIAKGLELLGRHYARPLQLAEVPAEDPAVYDMLCRADSIGVFQVESRAQMAMLPRLKPRTFYDLVIEVAIVRPGPIQGDMVHPYLRRRDGREPVSFPSPGLEAVLGKTLGVPLFQEQAMKIAIVAAGFTPSEADRLRRAMATFRRTGTIHQFEAKMIEGMVARGYARDFAVRCFKQIEGFGDYGFPESHAASFALLVYVSAWLKCHYPAVFACALLNSQPMGFYAPAQIVRDAAQHGVEVRPVDVNFSAWDCTLEAIGTPPHPALSPSEGERETDGDGGDGIVPSPPRRGRGRGEGGGPAAMPDMALRLGFRQVKGLREDEATRLLAARGPGYADIAGLWRRASLMRESLERLARADAFRSLGLDRRRALWAVKGLGEVPPPLFAFAERQAARETAAIPPSLPRKRESRATAALDSRIRGNDDAGHVVLPEMPLGQHVIEDYRALRLSLKAHPMAFLRGEMKRRGVLASERLPDQPAGRVVTVAGLVLVRQRPGTAKGVIFVTIEDEAAVANVIVRPPVFERYRRVVLGARLLLARGRVEREGIVIHVLADRLEDLSGLLDGLSELGPMEPPVARADVVKHPMSDPRTALPKGRSFR